MIWQLLVCSDSIAANGKCMVSGGFIPQTYQTAQK